MTDQDAAHKNVNGKALLINAVAKTVQHLGPRHKLVLLLPGHVVQGTPVERPDPDQVSEDDPDGMHIAAVLERAWQLLKSQGVTDPSLRDAIVLQDAVIHSSARPIHATFCVVFPDDVVGLTAGEEVTDQGALG